MIQTKTMQGRDGSDNSQQSLGICQRLFKLFLNNFIAQGLKRITMGSTTSDPMPHGSNEVPTEDGEPGKLTKPNGDQVRPNSDLGSEIIVEFRHTNGVGNWISLDNQIGGDHPLLMGRDAVEESKKGKGIDHQVVGIGIEPARGKEVTTLPRIEEETQPLDLGKEAWELKPRRSSDDHGKGPKKTVKINKKLDDNVVAREGEVEVERRTLAIQPEGEEGRKPRPPRHVRPLLSVTSNINKKSDEFIRRRKEAMSKNLLP